MSRSDAEHMSQKVSDRMFAYVMAQDALNSTVEVWVYTDRYSAACGGGYPVAHDIRN